MKIKKFLQPFAGINIDDNYSNRNVVRNNDGSYSVNYNNSNYTMLPSALDSNNITVTTPEVVVTGKRPYSSWRWGTYVPFEYSRNSYYRPEDAMEAFNALTGGGLNNLSPTQWYRRIRDLSKLHNGLLSKEDYWNKWLNGNEGLVSQDFQKEHPYWSAGINLLGDAATLGAFQGGKYILGEYKDPTSLINLNIRTSLANRKLPFGYNLLDKNNYIPFIEGTTKGLFGKAVKLKDLNPESFYTPLLYNRIVGWRKYLGVGKDEPLMDFDGEFIGGYKPNPDGTFNANLSLMQLQSLVNDFIGQGGKGLYDTALGVHGGMGFEYIPKSPNTGTLKYFDDFDLQPFLQFGKLVPKKIRNLEIADVLPGAKPFRLKGQINIAKKPENGSYILREPFKIGEKTIKLSDTSTLEDGTVGVRTGNKTLNDYIFDPKMKSEDILYNNPDYTPKSLKTAYKSLPWYLKVGTGIGLAGWATLGAKGIQKAYNNIMKDKQGGTIHIKKKNRGKFRDYCNGKVTNECIQRGKNSPNPVIRKRATFADNARHFKHYLGGKFNGFVKGVNVLDSDKDAYKYVKKKYKMRSALNGDNTNNWLQKAGKWLNSDQGKAFSGLASDLISYGVNLKNINKAYKQLKEALQKLYDYIASNIDDSQLKNQALENLTNLPEDQHVGMVDLLTEQEKLRREALKKQKTLADNWLTNQELNLNNWMQSVQGGASDNLQSSITNFINTYGNKDKV